MKSTILILSILLSCLAQDLPSSGDNKPQIFGPTEILTNTMGVDFGPYLTRVYQVVKGNWYRLIPESAMPPTKKRGKVAIRFLVLKDGKVSDMALDESSGDADLDRAAWRSLTVSNPLPPLPREYLGQNIGLRFYYFYNPTSEDLEFHKPIAAPIQVIRTGSSHQFTETPDGLSSDAVAWSVSGAGCSGSGCGVISPSGLYTAPSTVPNPPTITVVATSLSDAKKTVSTAVTIIDANRPR